MNPSEIIIGNDTTRITGFNDVWNYIDPQGNEYAVIGAIQGTIIYSISDPENPEFVHFIRGSNSTWRDIKHQGEYIYVTTDTGSESDGLLIIDMTSAPGYVEHIFWKPELIIGSDTTTLRTCHNLFIDENGVCYLSGCNLGKRGVIFLDITTDPLSPSVLGYTNLQYSHDAYVRGDTLWSSDIFEGEFTVWNIIDKANPELLARQTTTTVFTHNAWLSDDGKYLFTTDEKVNAGVDAYDVSDLSDIKLLDTYRPGAAYNRGVLPHNAHYYNGYLVISHYSEGVKIVDVHQPDMMVEVGSYDTSPNFNSGGAGNWGASPYSPRNLVLASDRQEGLYVFQPNYQRASYLIGNVSEEGSGEPIDDVEVIISDSEATRTFTNAFGEYNSGLPVSGTVEVLFTRFGFDTLIATVDIVQGEVTVLNVEMKRSPKYVISGKVVSGATGKAILGAIVEVENAHAYHRAETDSEGNFLIEDVVSFPEYSIEVGIWGHHEMKYDISVLGHLVLSTMTLDRGYKDDFILDLGWEATADEDVRSGFWVRERPIPTFRGNTPSNPFSDVQGDLGNECYVTGNGPGGPGAFDIDLGAVYLTSPVMNLQDNYDNPLLRYHFWWMQGSGSPSNQNDSIFIYALSGVDTVLLELYGPEDADPSWRESTFELENYLTDLSAVQILFKAQDSEPDHIVEMGVDAFLVEGSTVSVDEGISRQSEMNIIPNPAAESILVRLDVPEVQRNYRYVIVNGKGEQVTNGNFSGIEHRIDVSALPSGIYFIQVSDLDSRAVLTEKLVILKE